jgi:1-acyl-sn-glycerol-3-phosphate acyltransferase
MKKKISKFNKIFDYRYFPYDFVKVTGALPAIIYLRLKKHYLNGKKQKGLFKGPAIIVSNHATYIDPIIVMVATWNRRTSFIATEDLFGTKIRSFFFNAIRCIKINKQNVSMQTFKNVQDVINHGHLVGIFPEGHIQTKDSNDHYKSGAVMFATLCDVPIIQIYIHKNEHWWQRQHVVISDKINVKELINSKIPTVEEIEEVTKFLENQELELKKIIEK